MSLSPPFPQAFGNPFYRRHLFFGVAYGARLTSALWLSLLPPFLSPFVSTFIFVDIRHARDFRCFFSGANRSVLIPLLLLFSDPNSFDEIF